MRNGVFWIKSLFKNKSKDANLAWRAVLGDQSNKDINYVLHDLSVYCNVRKTSFVPKDEYQTAFNEGARDVFLHIIEMANLDLEKVVFENNLKFSD